MTIMLPVIAVAFTAFCVWAAVRTVNRRKQPGVAFWATGALVVVLVAYPLSMGPANYIAYQLNAKENPAFAVSYMAIYSPILWICQIGPESIRNTVVWYCNLWRG